MINVISDGCSQTYMNQITVFMVTALRRFAFSECFCTMWFRQKPKNIHDSEV